MAVQWTHDLSVGVDEIDKQHKELFRRINLFLDAMSQGKRQDEIELTIRFLADYVHIHFDTEEKYMAQSGYPGYGSHKFEHMAFFNTFETLRSRLHAEGYSNVLSAQLQEEAWNWLRNHIIKTDKVMGAFLMCKAA